MDFLSWVFPIEIPAMVDAEWQGQPRKLPYWAHRNGVFYVLKVDGKQHAAVAAGHGMLVFGLP